MAFLPDGHRQVVTPDDGRCASCGEFGPRRVTNTMAVCYQLACYQFAKRYGGEAPRSIEERATRWYPKRHNSDVGTLVAACTRRRIDPAGLSEDGWEALAAAEYMRPPGTAVRNHVIAAVAAAPTPPADPFQGIAP